MEDLERELMELLSNELLQFAEQTANEISAVIIGTQQTDLTADTKFAQLIEDIVHYEAVIINCIQYHSGNISEEMQLESGTIIRPPKPLESANKVKEKLKVILDEQLPLFVNVDTNEWAKRIKEVILIVCLENNFHFESQYRTYYRLATDFNNLKADWEIMLIRYRSGAKTKESLNNYYNHTFLNEIQVLYELMKENLER